LAGKYGPASKFELSYISIEMGRVFVFGG